MNTRAGHLARREHREAFWTVVLGVPATLSVLRLWVESGGDLQTLLLLVANVGALNLGAALFATVAPLITGVLIAVFAVGGALRVTADSAPDDSRVRRFPPVIARATEATPPWFIGAMFALALLTWPIYALPLLLPAAVATAQRPPWRLHDRWIVGAGLCLAAPAGYAWLVGPAVRQAWAGGEPLIAALLTLPPLVAFGVCGPLPARVARLFAVLASAAVAALAALAVQSAVRTPVLPLVVTQVQTGRETEYLRGHIVSVDDVHLVLLRERGGVRYIPIKNVTSTVLCGTPQEIPAFATRVRDYHVEDSLLRAVGRHTRPRAVIDPLCRMAPLDRIS
ncbi:hypothetical protein Aab01nite_11060 [Paractinoplanes abujensis]|uniref:Uncharacterized protein n=1 Tax=Paractinoplanes abujensis TaxID=882441 RepID=A0A7W7FZY5_9ACTN|nr:hypothetical protein [Actinoplanes abujensis]MBB4691072.1 hypothetical protein [Actinoplanes abujensis]GID17516.1 hypothetical protein Aab01nite_11060 [Actinoplanes abujensis]